MEKERYYVISHTHWDREWYQSREEYRFRLVHLIDTLLDILKKYPNYVFLLDAQYVVIEDYLQIRPDNEDILKKYVSSKNILIGPWYLQNDFLLTDGESTIRNLQRGISSSEKFGNCCKVGYAPDQFGSVSQMPQILNGFGLKSYVFGRGRQRWNMLPTGPCYVHQPVQFLWKAPNGSEVLSIHLQDWYNNAQRFSEDISKDLLLIDINHQSFKDVSPVPFYLLMNGVDHLEPQENLLPILDSIKKIQPSINIKQASIDDYIDDVVNSAKENHIVFDVFCGPIEEGDDYNLLRGCWSSRIWIKQANDYYQDVLENNLEPLMSYLEASGLKGSYDSGYLSFLWDSLMKNQPHDSICGCSCPKVAEHMKDRYERIGEASSTLFRNKLKYAGRHMIKNSGGKDGEFILTLWNGVPNRKTNNLVRATLTFPHQDKVSSFNLLSSSGEEVPFEVLSQKKRKLDFLNPIMLPGVMDCDCYEVAFYSNNEKMGLNQLRVVKDNHRLLTSRPLIANKATNEFYEISSGKNGLTLFDKKRNVKIDDFLSFYDSSDKGDLYVYEPDGIGEKKSVLVGSTFCSYKSYDEVDATFKLDLPVGFDFWNNREKKAHKILFVKATITLNKNDHVVRVHYFLNNTLSDHRLRCLIKGEIHSPTLIANSAFDVLNYQERDLSPKAHSKTFPAEDFVAIEDKTGEEALFGFGHHEFELTSQGIFVTILRSTGVISHGEGRGGTPSECYLSPSGQCHGQIDGEFGFSFFNQHIKNARLFTMAKAFRNPISSVFDSVNPKTFLTGRFAVQSSKLKEVYVQPDKNEGVNYQDYLNLSWDNDDVAFSSLHMSKDDYFILRLFSLSERSITCNLSALGRLSETNLKEDLVSKTFNNNISLSFAPKEIKTIRIVTNK